MLALRLVDLLLMTFSMKTRAVTCTDKSNADTKSSMKTRCCSLRLTVKDFQTVKSRTRVGNAVALALCTCGFYRKLFYICLAILKRFL